MTDSYIHSVKKRQARKATIGYYFFGLGFGNILLIASFLSWVNNPNYALDPLFIFGMAIAGIIIVSTFATPEIQKALAAVFRKIGTLIFAIILLLIYYIAFLPIGTIQRRRAKRKNPAPRNTNFVPHKNSIAISSSHKLRQGLHILRFFANEYSALIIPLIIVLILLGILLAFAQTSVVAPLVYVFF